MKKLIMVSLLCAPLLACSNNDEKTQQCINKIVELTSAIRFCDEPVGQNGIDITIDGVTTHYSQQEAQEKGIYNCSETAKYVVDINGFGMLSQEDALKISKNWNYDDIKLYNNDDNVIQDYERDACDVLKRLNEFIKEHSGNTENN